MAEQRDPERICLFGGTFDPIHLGHLRMADEALKQFKLSRVLFIPAANPPHKDFSAVTPYEDRYRMVEIACTPYPAFVPSRLEAGSEQSFTINTLERVRKDLVQGDEIFFLIGADAFDELPTWKRWREAAALTRFIVVPRPGKAYRVPEGVRAEEMTGFALPVSSSDIRGQLSVGEMVEDVPVEVREYIEQHGLYGTPRREPTASPSRSAD